MEDEQFLILVVVKDVAFKHEGTELEEKIINLSNQEELSGK